MSNYKFMSLKYKVQRKGWGEGSGGELRTYLFEKPLEFLALLL